MTTNAVKNDGPTKWCVRDFEEHPPPAEHCGGGQRSTARDGANPEGTIRSPQVIIDASLWSPRRRGMFVHPIEEPTHPRNPQESQRPRAVVLNDQRTTQRFEGVAILTEYGHAGAIQETKSRDVEFNRGRADARELGEASPSTLAVAACSSPMRATTTRWSNSMASTLNSSLLFDAEDTFALHIRAPSQCWRYVPGSWEWKVRVEAIDPAQPR